MDARFLSTAATVETPAYVVSEAALRRNLAILDDIQQRSNATILLALKGFAMWSTFPLLRQTLRGTCASGPHEARLGRELFGGEVHCFAPAFKAQDLGELLTLCDHLVFNSLSQWRQHRPAIEQCPRPPSCGLRTNPEQSVGHTPLYDPCAPQSRLGIRAADLATASPEDLRGIEGLHFHALCEQNSHELELVLQAFERKFAPWLPAMRWVNFGGGHHITRDDYDREKLIRLLNAFRDRHPHLQHLYLEPGEAVALQTGVLVTSVLDIVHNGMDIVILDTSATAHMPDVLEMPYRPQIVGAAQPGEKPHTYRLGGMTCLAGDVIGDYSFDAPLRPGDKLVFLDMAHYTMVKTTTFNGIQHPAIALHRDQTDTLDIVRRFTYEDYKNRLS